MEEWQRYFRPIPQKSAVTRHAHQPGFTEMGVETAEEVDEFDVRFGRHRWTDDWLENSELKELLQVVPLGCCQISTPREDSCRLRDLRRVTAAHVLQGFQARIPPT
jgi:hypothetical protein